MSRTLDVYLQRDLAGQLIQDENGELAFYYAGSWLNNARAMPLSHSAQVSLVSRTKACRCVIKDSMISRRRGSCVVS